MKHLRGPAGGQGADGGPDGAAHRAATAQLPPLPEGRADADGVGIRQALRRGEGQGRPRIAREDEGISGRNGHLFALQIRPKDAHAGAAGAHHRLLPQERLHRRP